ncbi:uncharacterized protein LOC114322489 isoform X1 [Camellia sinensis]|uniref:uncharacterized protein LOC114322489 isoform X1 n=1 Tax=Camellia sinensis TaxID=4442 RepID=UPI001036CE78|nr:uncharacterized protein LOC114322489 isoform X1 [Camellia sinensis]
MGTSLVRFRNVRGRNQISRRIEGYRSNIKKNFRKKKEGIYTNDVCFALISSLQQHSSKRRPSSKEATHPFPLKASRDDDARRVPMSALHLLPLLRLHLHLLLRFLLLCLHLPPSCSSFLLLRLIYFLFCRSASIWFCPLLHLFVFPPVRNWSEFLGAGISANSKQLKLEA